MENRDRHAEEQGEAEQSKSPNPERNEGLVERRCSSLDDGLERLASAVQDAPAAAGAAPEPFADHLLDVLLADGTRSDDVALLVLRVVLRAPEGV